MMNELEKLAPELSKIKKKSPFRAPDNYFDTFYPRLKIKIHEEYSGKRAPVIKFLRPALQLAAGLALLAILMYGAFTYLLPGRIIRIKDYAEATLTEEERISALIEKIDENSFFTLIQEPAQEERHENQQDNEELLNYLSYNVSDYEIFLETDY